MDRGKAGSKHRLIIGAHGILVAEITMPLRQLHHLDHPVQPRAMGAVDRIIAAVTQGRPMVQRATLVILPAGAGLSRDAERRAMNDRD
ncbi:hypothetical protein ACWGCP_26075 [Streptomyces niveus]